MLDPEELEKDGHEFSACPEVLEVILNNLDMERLRVCRLVCRSWNQEICRMFQKRGLIHLANDKSPVVLEKLISKGRLLGLPSPFNEVSLEVRPGTQSNVPAFERSGRAIARSLCITKLTLVYSLRVDESLRTSFFEVLEICAPTLTYLRTLCWGRIPADLEKDLKLPKLKALRVENCAFWNDELPESEMSKAGHDFLLAILAVAPEVSSLEVLNNTQARALIAKADMKKIHTLSVSLKNEVETLRMFLESLKLKLGNIEELKSLSIRFIDDRHYHAYRRNPYRGSITVENSPFLCRLVKEAIGTYSETLEHVSLLLDGLDQTIKSPFCPSLKDLEIRSLICGPRNFQKFPALKNVTINAFHSSVLPQDFGSPCETVQSVTISKAVSAKSNVMNVKKLFQLFPNALDWTTMAPLVPAFGEVLLADNTRTIEKLKINFRQEKELKCLDVLYKKLNCFKDLEELQLCDPSHTVDLTKLNLGQLPKLKTIGFYFNGPVRLAKLIRTKGFKTLENIVILSKVESKHSYTMEQLFCEFSSLKNGFKHGDLS